MGPRSPQSERHRLRVAAAAGVGAVAAVVLGSRFGSLGHGSSTVQRLVAFGAAAAFVVLSVGAIRELGSRASFAVALRTGVSAAAAIRLVVTTVGYVVILFVTLGMLSVSVERLLVGGAITGVIVGIAAQQALGNVFAGIVLLLARPFGVGERVRVRSGALGGTYEGVVDDISLTYVSITTDEGRVSVPNSGILGAAVIRLPKTPHGSHPSMGSQPPSPTGQPPSPTGQPPADGFQPPFSGGPPAPDLRPPGASGPAP